MEHILRCNALKCRKQLGDKALVTTCSHVFCPDCAARLGLTARGQDRRPSCPACNSPLTHPDDAVIALLNPSEDYKTSVLSGLTPHTIIEIASRGLSFWAYQTTQEVVYQEHLGKALAHKYSDLSVHLERVTSEANSDITSLQNKVNSISLEQDNLHKKNEELIHAYKEKSRKLLQIQELYDKLKQKAMLGQVQGAAEDAADATVQGGGRNVFASFDPPAPGQGHMPLYEQTHRDSSQDPARHSAFQPHAMAPPPPPRTFAPPGNVHDVPFTPSSHRQRLGDEMVSGPTVTSGLTSSVTRENMPPGLSSNSILRQSPRPGVTRYPGVGLSSGLKVSQATTIEGLGAPSTVPRAILRPIPNNFNSVHYLNGPPKSGLGSYQTH